MMKTLYLQCNMGAAGDMLLAALLELLPDRDAFLTRLNSLGLPGVRYAAESAAAKNCRQSRRPVGETELLPIFRRLCR